MNYVSEDINTMQLVQHFLEDSADQTPDKVALVCDGRRLTYAQIDAMSNRLAHALRKQGVKRGDRVLLFLPNSIELVVGIFAALKAGALFVVINSTTKFDKLAYMAQNCCGRAILLPAALSDLADDLGRRVDTLNLSVLSGKASQKIEKKRSSAACFLSFDDIQRSTATTRPLIGTIDQDLACLIYTSGSTGEPKGVMCGHNNVVFAASSIITYLENRSDDIVINGLPLSFDYGLYQLLMVFKFGGSLILERSYAYPAKILKLMETEKVTGLPGVPTLFSLLLNMDLSSYDMSRLRYISNTAAALPSSHIRAIREKFPAATLYSMYGLTETKRTLFLPPEQLDQRADSVGIAIPGTEVWIEDEEGRKLGSNQVGELVIRGGHVMRGYWENPEATALRYRSGPTAGERRCYSGDLFRMDDEGFFYFVGRQDDIIKSRGEKVPPKEIEGILYAIPEVVEAAVVGVPDPVLGEAIKAFVVLAEGSELTDKDILLHCRGHLEDFMVPQMIEFRDMLPKNPSGKIQKNHLQ